MSQSTLYTWKPDINYSDNFSLETKYYDLGTTGINKNIYSISLSFGINIPNISTTVEFLPHISIDYRTTTIGEWIHYATYMNQSRIDWQNTSEKLQTITKKNKLKKIPGIQLRLTGFLAEDFIINDISIEYRNIRKRAVGSPS